LKANRAPGSRCCWPGLTKKQAIPGDVQWADPATMQAFRSMPRLLASYRMSWILAMGTSADAGQAELPFDLLENDGAARTTLGPLDLAP
jgi:hypothetical protein